MLVDLNNKFFKVDHLGHYLCLQRAILNSVICDYILIRYHQMHMWLVSHWPEFGGTKTFENHFP